MRLKFPFINSPSALIDLGQIFPTALICGVKAVMCEYVSCQLSVYTSNKQEAALSFS